MSLKKILIAVLGLTVILGGCFFGCEYHNSSAKQSYEAARNFVSLHTFNSDSSLFYVGKLDSPSCVFCMDGFHQSDSVLELVEELKMQDTVCQIFSVVREKLQSSHIDFSDLENTKIAIDSFPQIKNGMFMYDSQCAELYKSLTDLCIVSMFMDNVSTYLQADEWNYDVLSGHLKQLQSLDIVNSGAFTEAKYKNFMNRYNQLSSDRKLRGRMNKGDFWSLVDLYNEEGVQNCMFDEKYSLLKEFVQDETMFNGFYSKNKSILAISSFSKVKSLWNDYKEAQQPIVAETVTDFEIEMQPSVQQPIVKEEPVASEPAKKTETKKTTTVKSTATTTKKTTTKATSTKESKPSAAANRSYSDMMYGDAVEMDDSKRYSSDSDVLDAIATRSALYQLNKNNVIGSSLKAKVQSLKNLLDKVTESEYSHCYSSASSLQDLNEALTKISQNR
ncbi:MAG: hypothetical protein MJ197_03700 [Bacteroidales bacterium]|nr:hypothetical protein [Bacteroidales bacterium]